MFTRVQISEIVYWLKLEYIGDALYIQVSVRFYASNVEFVT